MAGSLHALLLEESVPGAVALAPGTGLFQVSLPLGTAEPPRLGFYELTGEVERRARELSARGTVAYVHGEFFGGHGFQAAVAWRGGSVVWGPVFTETVAGEAEDHYEVAGPGSMAVNRLLRWWGVRAGDAVDEYAAARLVEE
ncbi:hypothetical protein [Symbioplanes lichenis]|uniref:hypothetical protein n=1 Tax=Symbioplanes lichenis TaxID=1629072 RepID=UPI00273A51DC|nr:hypothetical protein [Actinoplanes lichenis]